MTQRPTARENFLYLLGEMEKVVDSGAIRWSPPETEAIPNRLIRIAQQIARASDKPCVRYRRRSHS